MLLILFNLGEDKYAIDSQFVIKIIPLINLKKVSSSVSPVAGVFNYGGKVIPVIDLKQLLQGKPCQPLLSTRIILVQHTRENKELSFLGLKAEKVTDIIHKTQQEFIASDFQGMSGLFLGDMIHDDQGMIQYIHIDHLLSQLQQKKLLHNG